MFFNRYVPVLLVVPFDFLFSFFFCPAFVSFLAIDAAMEEDSNDISDVTAFVSKLIAPRQERTLAYCNFLLQRKSETKDCNLKGARALALDRGKGKQNTCISQLPSYVIFADRIDPPL